VLIPRESAGTVAPRTALIVTAILLLGATGCGGSSHGFSQPFVVNGGIEAGPGSGLWGDTVSGPDGMHLGCLARRHYALVVTMRNRSNAAVTLTGARGPDPAPRIIRRGAVQFRLAPPPPKGDLVVTNLRRWSAAAAVPVTIPPGRSAAVQSNFLMRHCDELGRNRTLVVDGSLVLGYRASGHAHRQELAQRSARIILTRGPTIRRCTRLPRSAGLVAADIPCKVARRAALGCHRLSHRTWGTCSAAGHAWNCTSTAPAGRPSLESCWLASKSQWFKVRWTD
jgi:hypothetical protein